MAKLAREQAQQGQQGVLNTEIKLGEKRAQAAAAQAQFGLQQAGMLASLAQRAAAARGQASSANTQAQLAALSGLSNLRTDVPGELGLYFQSMLGNQGQLGQLAGGMNAAGAAGKGQPGSTERKIGMGASVAVPIAIALI